MKLNGNHVAPAPESTMRFGVLETYYCKPYTLRHFVNLHDVYCEILRQGAKMRTLPLHASCFLSIVSKKNNKSEKKDDVRERRLYALREKYGVRFTR